MEVNLKLGRLAEIEGDYDRAFEQYNETREKGLKAGITVFYFEGTIRVAHVFYKEKNYEAATAALSTAYVNAIERENLNYQKEVLEIQRRTFAATGDYQNAYAVMTQLDGVTSQIRAQQQQRLNRELEVQYETLQKEKEIDSLQEDQILKAAELKRQKTIKNAFLIGFLIILIPIFALLYVYYQKLQAQSQLSSQQEELNKQKMAALKQEQELNLIKASIDGQDEERKRIAQELHDSIGGNLAGIKLQLASLDGTSKKLKPISDQLDETYQLVRDISHTLIPKKFREHEFTGLLQEYLNSISGTGQVQIGFHPHPKGKINTIDEKEQLELFNIVKELMTNTLKHAEATKVDIHLSLIDDELSLLFEDNGNGFDATVATDGIGFQNIKNRVAELKGKLHIDSTLKRGTIISIEIPIHKIS
ncbi:sensor histidine kinase [Maribacter halichondriae]|uniref:sensor histidine kinase n=1 Tax=Maribacter halichondriae TaxID=2980554 RepID=UPI002359543C|nr:ATP-binding protein [Maribacter sp. Hal144]